MSEDLKMETTSAIGNTHQAMCWGHWDGKVAECKICFVAEKCAETTKRIQAKGQSSAPAAAKEDAPVAKPVSKPEASKPEVEKPPKVTTKSEATKPEATPKSIVVEDFANFIKDQLGGDTTAKINDGENFIICNFFDAKGKLIMLAGVKKDGSIAKLRNPDKKDKVQSVEPGYKDSELAKVIAALR